MDMGYKEAYDMFEKYTKKRRTKNERGNKKAQKSSD
jgi:hypothetical protein